MPKWVFSRKDPRWVSLLVLTALTLRIPASMLPFDLLLALGVAALFALRRSSLDEGGIRFPGLFGFARRYRPFSALARVEPLRGGGLVAFDHNGAFVERWTEAPAERELERYDALSRGIAAETCGPYRSASLDLERAVTLVGDHGAPIAVRAGAAFALLSAKSARYRSVACAAAQTETLELTGSAADSDRRRAIAG